MQIKSVLNKFLSVSENVSLNRQIIHASSLILLSGVVVKLFGFVKEQMTASAFGTQVGLNVFILACAVPLFLVSVIGGSFNAAFTPTYIRVREIKGEKASQELLSQMGTLILVLLGMVAFFCYMGRDLYLPFLTEKYGKEDAKIAGEILLIIIPGVVASGFSILWNSVLNSQKKFILAALIPAVIPLVIFVAIFFGVSRYGIKSLAWGTTAGMVLEAVITGIMLAKTGTSLKFGLISSNNSDLSAFKSVVGQLIPVISSTLILGSNPIIDQAMCSRLAPEGIAVLAYASRLIAFPVSLVSTAIGTAVVPYFAIIVANRDYRLLYKTLNRYLLIIFTVMFVVTLIVISFSGYIVKLIFERGSFTEKDTMLVSNVLIFLAIQLPFYPTGTLVTRMVSSLMLNKLMVYGNIINVILNVSLNIIFAKKIGVSGIALSSSVVSIVTFSLGYSYLVYFLKGRIHE